jgi:hypothetical protein
MRRSMTRHTGSCHCGAVAFAVEGDIPSVMECNCSHCSRKGFLLHFLPKDAFTLKTPEAPLTGYLFNRHAIEHRFCPSCGVQGFAYGKDPSSGAEMVAINVRCLDGVDLAAIPRVQVDGKSF